MKNLSKFLGVTLIAIFLTSCMAQKAIAPAGRDVKLATGTEPLPFKKEQRDWYVLWGLVPINNTASDRVIQENNLKTVRVTTVTTPLDFIINIFTSIASIVSRTELIEGSAESNK